MKQLFLLALAFCAAAEAAAQGYSYYEDTQFDPFQRQMYRVGAVHLHPALRHYKLDELREYFDLDSLIYDGIPQLDHSRKHSIFRNFIFDDFLAWRDIENDVYLAINPMMDLQIGKDGDRTTYLNQRGAYVNGNLGKNFWFYLDLTENQACFPEYVMQRTLGVVPGHSNCRSWDGDPDWNTVNGYIAFNVGKHVDIQIGKFKTFIGDGYRSLFLSDAAAPYPAVKFNFTFLNAKYMMMMSQLRTPNYDQRHRPKYSFSHYLDWNISDRFNFGIFENVTMCSWYRLTDETRLPDLGYMLPFTIFRPEEFNAGSPDKMVVGLSARLTATDWLAFYSQLMFNEFQIKDLTARNRNWKNKYGYQFGARVFDMFRVVGLDMQLEYNHVRPFCYTQYEGMATYTHHGEPLAHPLGANFHEGVLKVHYRNKRLALKAQANYAKYGADIKGDTCTYGQNLNIASENRNKDLGVATLQGDLTKLAYVDVAASFIINPRSMMNVAMGYRMRNQKSDFTNVKSNHFYFALRWSLKERLFDF